MRIIAGSLRSRRLEAPPGLATRPTSDRLRETLFNVLAAQIAGAAFLDLYAGSGAVGIEAMSRGAAQVTWVEREPAALKTLRQNLERLGLTSQGKIAPMPVKAFLRKAIGGPAFDLIFVDPPYDAAQEYEGSLNTMGSGAAALLKESGTVIVEHRRKEHLADNYGRLRRTRLLEQGDAALSFYSMAKDVAG